MTRDSVSEFGRYGPTRFFGALLLFAQGMPHNWFGQQLAQLARKLVLRWSRLPIDVAVAGVRMRCYLRDNNSEKKFVFMPWRFDVRERQLLRDTLGRDGTFVDIGANVGIYTLTAATHLGSRGRIVALEPNPPAYQRLCFNLNATQASAGEWPRIDALELGVGDVAEERDLHLDPANLGGSSIAGPAGSPLLRAVDGTGVVRVRCKPLLAILDEIGVRRVDALKIDIEGAEDLALCPFLAQADDCRLPQRMVIENSEHLWQRDLLGALRQRGYRVELRTHMNTVYLREPDADTGRTAPAVA